MFQIFGISDLFGFRPLARRGIRSEVGLQNLPSVEELTSLLSRTPLHDLFIYWK